MELLIIFGTNSMGSVHLLINQQMNKNFHGVIDYLV